MIKIFAFAAVLLASASAALAVPFPAFPGGVTSPHWVDAQKDKAPPTPPPATEDEESK